MKLFRRRRRWSIVTTARWEAPYIAEWLAYHRAIGFDHVYLYCNDDDPGELYTAASPWIERPEPFVTFTHWPHPGQQWWMIIHYLQEHRRETEWVLFLDVDEFLSLRADADIGSFLRRRPDTDCVYFHWAMFGHMGFAERPGGSVLRRYVRRQAGLNPWTKAITRTDRIDPSLFHPGLRGNITHPHHGWERGFSPPGLRSQDVLGADMSAYWPDNEPAFDRLISEPGRTERMFSEAVVHHYAFRSRADFDRRMARGLDGDFAGQAVWGAKTPEDADRFLAELDAVEDRTLARWWASWLGERTAVRSMTPPAPAPLISSGKPCMQSSAWSPDGLAPQLAAAAGAAVDGRPLSGGWAVHTEAEAEPWWQVDLQAPHRVAEVRLYNRMAGAEQAVGVRISLSDDGKRWRQVHVDEGPGVFGGADGRPLIWRPERPTTARFVRVHLDGGILHLEQVEIFGAPA